jgi:hypothetical protein
MCAQEGFEGQMNENNIEIGVADASGFRRLEVWVVPAQACAHPASLLLSRTTWRRLHRSEPLLSVVWLQHTINVHG